MTTTKLAISSVTKTAIVLTIAILASGYTTAQSFSHSTGHCTYDMEGEIEEFSYDEDAPQRLYIGNAFKTIEQHEFEWKKSLECGASQELEYSENGEVLASKTLDFPDSGGQTSLSIDLSAESGPVALCSSCGAPLDLNGNGLYQDINGDGELNSEDASVLSRAYESVSSENIGFFDFNDDGDLDTEDINNLESRIETERVCAFDITGSVEGVSYNPEKDQLIVFRGREYRLNSDATFNLNIEEPCGLKATLQYSEEGEVIASEEMDLPDDGGEVEADIDLSQIELSDEKLVDNNKALFERYDSNSDGVITNSELAAAAADFRDGERTREELNAVQEAWSRDLDIHMFTRGEKEVNVDFDWSPENPVPGERVEFDARIGSESVDIQETDYMWRFEDGGTIYNDSEPVYRFRDSGESEVELTLSLEGGREASKANKVVVSDSSDRDYPLEEMSLSGSTLIVNGSYRSASSHSPELEIRKAGAVIESVEIEGRGEDTFEENFELDDASGGFSLQAEIDPDNEVGEADESNNVIEREFNSDSSVTLDVIESDFKSELIDEVNYEPSFRLETDAEQVELILEGEAYELFDDGIHPDRSSSDGWYRAEVPASEKIGEIDQEIKAVKDGKAKTVTIESVEFKKTPPNPDLSMNLGEGAIGVSVNTNSERNTAVQVNLTVEGSESGVVYEKSAEQSCTEECSFNFDSVSLGEGYRVDANVSQRAQGLKSTASASKVFGNGVETELVESTTKGFRELYNEDYSHLVEDVEPAEVDIAIGGYQVVSGYVSFRNLDEENVERIYLENSAGENLEDFTDYRFVGDQLIRLGSAEVQASDLEHHGYLDIVVETETGEVLRNRHADVDVVGDYDSPRIKYVNARKEEDSAEVIVNVDDNLSPEADYSITRSDGTVVEEGVWDLESGVDSFNVEANGDDVTELDISVQDMSDNLDSKTYSIVWDYEHTVDEYRVSGEPENKINLLVYGNRMSSHETKRKLDRNINKFYNDEGYSFIGEYRNYFNWYVVDTNKKLCDEITGHDSEGSDCENGIDEMEEIISKSDKIRNSRTGIIILDPRRENSEGEWIRSYASRDYTIVSEQDESSTPFTHELGHLVWGFNDEYGSNPGDNSVKRDSYFFPDGMEEGFNTEKYPNIWRKRENCVSNVTKYYASLDASDCETQGGGYVIKEDSFMQESDSTTLYENHEKRIRHLMENSSIYKGEVK